MQGDGRDPFFNFGNPFGGFGGLGGFSSGYGGSGAPRSLISSFFGGRDPFDDPFFTRPFGGMFGSSIFGPSMDPFTEMRPSGFIEHQQPPEPRRSRGPIIEEINSDDEEEQKGKKGNLGKHGRSGGELDNEDPEDRVEGRRNKQIQYMNDNGRVTNVQRQSQNRCYTFQSSSVTYGGHSGDYYTSSKTRRTGSDGLTVEESREANSATREATHRVSRGFHSKGHTVTRKLNSDGQVDTMQTLHNLNEDELAGFEQAWDGNARNSLPGWTGSIGSSTGAGNGRRNDRPPMALPSTTSGPPRRTKAAMNVKERVGHSRGHFRN
ncbi:PREDICTED: uncharacterized protein LOC104813900 isoform X2 [Tarenaya hassleriana]|uniref:uncharacterized protein LOC104813900 isoform X2 n=1 Tax=Tarenaya hassleriana TaxID=28532 RepID=UPI00053C6295|nr:PREDICTED: uncharacterized protein LOC104813900 isoform X2 [Tarenaya hassleriana]